MKGGAYRQFLIIWAVFILGLEGRGEAGVDLQGALEVLDRFVMAGKEGNALRGARLLDVYESSPKKTERDISLFFKKKEPLFADCVSLGSDLYGYEYREKGYRGPNLSLEGRLETRSEAVVEFSARLVLRDSRWRILSFEID